MESFTGRRHKNIIADAGYESEENYTFFEGREDQVCFIKPANYERSNDNQFVFKQNDGTPYHPDHITNV